MSVLRAWKILEEDLVDGLEFLSLIPSWIGWNLNALYETLQDKPAPGAASQVVKGHDHYAAADGGHGGRIVGRNMAAMLGAGTFGYGEVTVTGGTVNTWIKVPTNYSGSIPSFRAWCSAGMVSPSGNAPAAPNMDAYIFVYSPVDCDIRIVHGTTSFASAVASFSPSSPFFSDMIRVANIPANDEGWNQYDLEVRSASEGTISIGYGNISESPIVEGSYVAGSPPSQSQQLGGV